MCRKNLSVPSSRVFTNVSEESISPFFEGLYQCVGTTYFFLHQGSLKNGLKDCPYTSVRNYHYMLHNIQEESRSHLILLPTLRIKTAKCVKQKQNILQLPTRIQTGLALLYIVMVTVFFEV